MFIKKMLISIRKKQLLVYHNLTRACEEIRMEGIPILKDL